MSPLFLLKAFFAVPIALLLAFASLGDASPVWEMNFANEPEGEWRIEEGYPDFRKSGGDDLRLEVVPISKPGVSESTRALRLSGGTRGFRNIRDSDPFPARCRIAFDFCLHRGAFQWVVFESARNVSSRGRGLFLFFENDGKLKGRSAEGQELTEYGVFTKGIWYRATIDLEIASEGGGTFRLTLTDLDSGASVPLEGGKQWPLGVEVTSLAGLDIGLLRRDAELLIEKIEISDLPMH